MSDDEAAYWSIILTVGTVIGVAVAEVALLVRWIRRRGGIA